MMNIQNYVQAESLEEAYQLNQKRSATLDEIHFRERQLERLDYLRHEIRKTQK